MNKLFGKRTQHALFFSDDVLRYARVKGRSLEGVEKLEERELPEGLLAEGEVRDVEGLLQVLKECVDTWNLWGKQIVFSVPDPLVFMEEQEAELDTGETVESWLKNRGKEKSRVPFEKPVWDWYEVSREENSVRLLLFAAPEAHVMTLSRLLREAGARPAAADASFLGLYRLYEAFEKEEQESHPILIQVEKKSHQLTLFKEGLPVEVRSAARENKEGSADRTTEEVRKLAADSGDGTYIIVSGGEDPAALVRELKEETGLPVSLFNESDWQTAGREPIEPQFYTVIGLALKREVS